MSSESADSNNMDAISQDNNDSTDNNHVRSYFLQGTKFLEIRAFQVLGFFVDIP